MGAFGEIVNEIGRLNLVNWTTDDLQGTTANILFKNASGRGQRYQFLSSRLILYSDEPMFMLLTIEIGRSQFVRP